MDDSLHLLRSARFEILELRKQNQLLMETSLELVNNFSDVNHRGDSAVIEVFAAALGLRKENNAMTVDIAWELERRIEQLSQPEQKGVS